MIARLMAKGKTTTIAAILLLVLALGLASRFFTSASPATGDKKASVSNQAATETHRAPEKQIAAGQPDPHTPDETTSPPAITGTKQSERKESLTIRDLEKHGIFVEAEHVGKNSASGKVKITYKSEMGDAVLEADRAKMSPNGMLVAEGNVAAVQGESRFGYGGENGAMAIYLDEKTQHVTIRVASAAEVTKEIDPNDPAITDPDRNGTR